MPFQRLQYRVAAKSEGPERDGWAASPGAPLPGSVTQATPLCPGFLISGFCGGEMRS